MNPNQKLPLWRLITGFAVIGGFGWVVASLAPVYVDNYRLGRYVHDLAAASPAAIQTDDQLKTQIIGRAHQLDLPLTSGDIQVVSRSGKRHLEAKYKVKMDLGIYPVDLHMPASSADFPITAGAERNGP